MEKGKLIPPDLGKAVRVFSKIHRLKFLYINSDLLLCAAPKDTMMKILKSPDVENSIKFQIVTMMSSFDIVTNHCNDVIKDLKRIKVKINGLHVSNNSIVPSDIIFKLCAEEIKLNELPNDIQEKLIVQSLTNEDYIKPQQGNVLDWLSFMIPDGKVFPYTILSDNALCGYGYPIGLYTKGDEDIDPGSIKNIYYKDPKIQDIKKGIYFEVYEGPGAKGIGGVNGIIVEGNKPIIIINTDKKEAYFINVEESTKNLSEMALPLKTLEVMG